MKLFKTNIPSIMFALMALWLIANKYENGWGWFLILSVMSLHVSDNDKKDKQK